MSNMPPPLPPPPSEPYGAPSTLAIDTSPPDTAGLRKAAIVLFWGVAGTAALLTMTMFSRRQTWHSDDVTLDDLQTADNLVAAASLATVGVALAAVIVISIWSLRTGRHAQQTGATNVSPGLACGGWYIPFANLIVPFVQLRRIVGHRGRPRGIVNVWQGLLIASWVLNTSTRSIGNDIDSANSFDEVSSTLTTQSVAGIFATICLATTAAVAARAMKTVDAVI